MVRVGTFTTTRGMSMKWLNRYEEQVYAILRMVVGFMFLFHGLRKLFGLFGDPVVVMSLRGLAGVIELFGGTMIMLGLFTAPAAFLCSGTMAVAYFYVHQPQGAWPVQNKGELAALYCFVFLFLAARGSGKWSVDAWRFAKRSALVGVIAAITFAGVAEPAAAQQLLPKLKIGSGTLDVHGWAHTVTDTKLNSTEWSSARFRARYNKPKGLGAFVDLDLRNLDKQGGIKRLLVTYNTSSSTQVRVGRFPVSSFYFAPSDIALETVRYARFPFAFYATGVQVEHRGKGWTVLTDVTGNSSKRAYDRSQMDRLELSTQVTHAFRSVTLSEFVQVSSDFFRVGLGVSDNLTTKLRYRTVVYASRTKDEGTLGGHMLAAYRIRPWLEHHTQVDFQRRPRVTHTDPIITSGLRLMTRPEWLLLTVEKHWYLNRPIENRFLMRAQIRY